MPEDVIHKSWIEQDIRSWGIDVFIELVRRERPDVCLAAKQFSEWLGADGIAGGPIDQKETLIIELNALQTARETEEIQDSEGDDDLSSDGSDGSDGDGDGDGDGRVVIAQSPVRQAKSASNAPLRQTTLPELFQAAL